MTAHRLAYDLGKMGELADPGDEGTIDVTGRSGVTCGITTAGAAETRTITQPTSAGQTAFFYHKSDGGSAILDFGQDVGSRVDGGTLTLTDEKIVLTDLGDAVLVISVNLTATTYRFVCIGQYGAGGTS